MSVSMLRVVIGDYLTTWFFEQVDSTLPDRVTSFFDRNELTKFTQRIPDVVIGLRICGKQDKFPIWLRNLILTLAAHIPAL